MKTLEHGTITVREMDFPVRKTVLSGVTFYFYVDVDGLEHGTITSIDWLVTTLDDQIRHRSLVK